MAGRQTLGRMKNSLFRGEPFMTRPTKLLVCMAFLIVLASCSPKQQTQAAGPAPAVGVHAAELKGVARSYEFVGRIQATNTVALRARVEGFIEKVLFREGQDVKAGDLLYQIESAPYQAQVDQAKANVLDRKSVV